MFQSSTTSSAPHSGTDVPNWTFPYPESSVAHNSSQYSNIYFQVCREYQRGTCTRPPSECRFAHPHENVTVDSTDNHVTVCMDYVKGKCWRDSCRYFHPPPHLQAQIKAAQQRANAAAAQAQALVGTATACSFFSHRFLQPCCTFTCVLPALPVGRGGFRQGHTSNLVETMPLCPSVLDLYLRFLVALSFVSPPSPVLSLLFLFPDLIPTFP